MIKHGHTRAGRHAPEYAVWCAMKARCTNPNNKNYADYGGRGITVCDRWLGSYQHFIDDIGRRPSKRHSLERVRNAEGYGPGNCVWATREQQGRNKRNNRLLTFDGRTQCLTAWATEIGVAVTTITMRIGAYGWSVERALTTPVGGSSLCA